MPKVTAKIRKRNGWKDESFLADLVPYSSFKTQCESKWVCQRNMEGNRVVTELFHNCDKQTRSVRAYELRALLDDDISAYDSLYPGVDLPRECNQKRKRVRESVDIGGGPWWKGGGV